MDDVEDCLHVRCSSIVLEFLLRFLVCIMAILFLFNSALETCHVFRNGSKRKVRQLTKDITKQSGLIRKNKMSNPPLSLLFEEPS
jgi:hypothetical protein